MVSRRKATPRRAGRSPAETGHFIYTLEARQGLKIACLEEIAYLRGFIDRDRLDRTLADMPQSPYRQYLEKRFPK